MIVVNYIVYFVLAAILWNHVSLGRLIAAFACVAVLELTQWFMGIREGVDRERKGLGDDIL